MTEEVDTAGLAVVTAIESSDDPQGPEETDSPGIVTSSRKRRQSSSSNTDSKRRLLSNEIDAQPKSPKVEAAQENRRNNGQLEERKRGQRLFGALIGTLSQGKSSAAQRKRADIEKRQQDKLKQQEKEDTVRRKERLAELQAERHHEQRNFEGRRTKLRHANILHIAGFLQTRAEPKLYYKPWELTTNQETQIKRQIEAAQTKLEQELDDTDQEREENDSRYTNAEELLPDQAAASAAMDDESTFETNTVTATAATTGKMAGGIHTAQLEVTTGVAGAFQEDDTLANGGANDAVEDGQDELVVEADEDTVIY